MSVNRLLSVLVLMLAAYTSLQADEPIFSGPQVGEQLPNFKATYAMGKEAGKEFDIVSEANGKPLLLVFFHARTRLAFGMTRAIAKFAATKSASGMRIGVIFLTNDKTEVEQWASNIKNLLSPETTYGISPEGIEGPGSYGLNRNVALTIIVANEGKVVENSALAQPQLAVDGPKILKAIADVTGGGKVPTIEELEGGRGAGMSAMQQKTANDDAKLRELLRPLIAKQASDEAVQQAAEAVEKYAAEHEVARKEIGRISNTIVNSGKLENYGTAAAQEVLRGWAKKYGEK